MKVFRTIGILLALALPTTAIASVANNPKSCCPCCDHCPMRK
jgi:hypothetical protein